MTTWPQDIPLEGRAPQVWAAWCERWEALADQLFAAMIGPDTATGQHLRGITRRLLAGGPVTQQELAYLQLEIAHAGTKAQVMAAVQLGDPYGEVQPTGDVLDALNKMLGLTPPRTDEEGH